MKTLFVLILIAGQTLFAQQQWYQCLHSYSQAQSSLIDIRYGSVSSEEYMIFRNGNHFASEELNVFYKGKFWKAPLQITEDFYQRRSMSLRLGEDRLCFDRNFKWILTDRSELSRFSQSACGTSEVITMRENSQEQHPTAEEVLAYKLQKDVKFQGECVAGRAAGGCSPSNRREDFERLQRWNTSSCSQLENSSVQAAISLFTEAIQIFNSTAANTTAPE